MPPRRRLPPNAETAVRAHMEPVLLKGGETVKSLSTAFLADLEEDWRTHGKKVFPVLREKYPQAYFGGLVALAKMIRWETAEEMLSDGGMTPDEIMDKLEQRVGPEGRKLFEDFLRKVNEILALDDTKQMLTVAAHGACIGRQAFQILIVEDNAATAWTLLSGDGA